jgi:hypothetical protein
MLVKTETNSLLVLPSTAIHETFFSSNDLAPLTLTSTFFS